MSANAKHVLIAVILSTARITTLVADRVSPTFTPQFKKFPFLACSLIDDIPTKNLLNEGPKLWQGVVQVDIIAETYAEASVIASIMYEDLEWDGGAKTVDGVGVHVDTISLQGEHDGDANEVTGVVGASQAQRFRIVQRWSVSYTRNPITRSSE